MAWHHLVVHDGALRIARIGTLESAGADSESVVPALPAASAGSAVTIGVSYRNVPYADVAAYTPAAVGSPAVGTDPNSGAAPHSYRNPYTPIPNDGTLQDCSPYPASLYDTSPAAGLQPERQWNALYGSGSELDGALFEFSAKLSAATGSEQVLDLLASQILAIEILILSRH